MKYFSVNKFMEEYGIDYDSVILVFKRSTFSKNKFNNYQASPCIVKFKSAEEQNMFTYKEFRDEMLDGEDFKICINPPTLLNTEYIAVTIDGVMNETDEHVYHKRVFSKIAGAKSLEIVKKAQKDIPDTEIELIGDPIEL